MLYPDRIAMALCFWLSYGMPKSSIAFNGHYWRQLLRGLNERPELFLDAGFVLPLWSMKVYSAERELLRRGWTQVVSCKGPADGLLPVMSQTFFSGKMTFLLGEEDVVLEWCDIEKRITIEASSPESQAVVIEILKAEALRWFDFFNSRVRPIGLAMPELQGSLLNISNGNPVPPRELLCRIQCYSDVEQQWLVEFLRWGLPDMAMTLSDTVLN